MRLVFKNLLRRKLRTLFSVLGVGVGVSIMVALFTISDDLVHQLQFALETQRGDVFVSQATAEELESDVPVAYTDQLLELEGVKSASPMIAAMLRTDNDFHDRPAILYYGVTENNPIVRHMEMIEGEPISDDEPGGVVFGEKAWEIVQEKIDPDKRLHIGKELNLIDIITSEGFGEIFGKPENYEASSAFFQKMWFLTKLKTLGIHPDALTEETDEMFRKRTGRDPKELRGALESEEDYRARTGLDPTDPANIRQMRLQLYVRGVCRTGIMIQDSAVFFPLGVAQLIKGKHRRTEKIEIKENGKTKKIDREILESCTWILLEVEDEGLAKGEKDERINAIRDRINADIPELRAVRSEDLLQRYRELEWMDQFAWVISLIAALAGAIGILNTMTLAVYERTREIGLMLAIGWKRLRVVKMVLLEGLVISLVGGIFGVVFGYAEVQTARTWFSLDIVSPELNLVRSGQALLLAFSIGFLATLYPAWRASRLTPMDALRHE